MGRPKQQVAPSSIGKGPKSKHFERRKGLAEVEVGWAVQREPSQMKWPKKQDIPGTVLVIALVAIMFYWHFTHPEWQMPSGFGPEWQCPPGAKPDFCYKKPTADAGEQAPSN
jgi:hypothetical protein